jgi:hypothetical protein
MRGSTRRAARLRPLNTSTHVVDAGTQRDRRGERQCDEPEQRARLTGAACPLSVTQRVRDSNDAARDDPDDRRRDQHAAIAVLAGEVFDQLVVAHEFNVTSVRKSSSSF